ncbi:hypothetical protein [Niabella ginsengisoli]|uniref:Peptidase M1 membrane alanine aminopeptidase domain-containing protein n=1 Tax=Niabella ginsengisoli TaxID=522298 RepID=A0ABS9SIX2_9BACT|nr:hypothetical protein [Niabella ginsengisoli]MCH5598129.1 hypothetical protein [Niabella ginsengisoli]
MVRSGLEEPLNTHADHFNTNYAYSVASYSKGSIFMEQLGYIVGAQVRDKVLLEYDTKWKFKHPNINDLIRLSEKVSGLKLDWYQEFWVNSTKTIDYAIDSVWEQNGKTNIRLRNEDLMPMPIDLVITTKNGSQELHHIPLDLMYGSKPAEGPIKRTEHPAWHWTSPTYTINTDLKLSEISQIEIDPTKRMADVEQANNVRLF